ncbi:MAG: sigma 54-interacting transcriptional regulator [Deltaproteobacteria bacterium]|nr:sigma 54-interacting transcriptional regulator [Deltaproteobacteria bacterium]MBW2445724.1 sigma 54-interacting transcriptional regulator [Deltaproteobacteria bacterium]
MSSPPSHRTLGELVSAGVRPRSLRDEIRANLLDRLRKGTPLFPGVLGFEETVVPAVENALLSGHDIIFLGERGQAKSRMIRALVELLDEWVPEIAGSEVRDCPFAPVSRYGKDRIAEEGEATEIAWVHRDDRYVEKLATPDVSIADLIGDVDPIKVAQGRTLADELTIHFGLLPRTNRGIFCINELPDLTEKVQVGMFNVMEERDVQVKGYQVRLPLDVLVVASANPEDYTSRGRIITPLKDRYAAQIRTHYPKTRALELEIVRQEARRPDVPGIEVHVPSFLEEVVVEVTHQARQSPDVNQTSGVSVRMTLANYETLMANAVRRALRNGDSEAVPRISDLPALEASATGKLELEYAGSERSEREVIAELVDRAVRVVFEGLAPAEGLAPVVEAFDQGWQVEVSEDMPAAEYLEGLDQIPGLREGAAALGGGDSPERLASAIEFILEGLHLQNRLNKNERDGKVRYAQG